MKQRIVLVGGGHSAVQICNALADRSESVTLTLVCGESSLPYHRPPLSKDFLARSAASAKLHRDRDWFLKCGFRIHLSDPACSIDRARRVVVLRSGTELCYDKLVLATGARARMPRELEGLSNVFKLRSLKDAELLRSELESRSNGHFTVLGGGFIGLEVAASLRARGWGVTLFEQGTRLLSRAVSPQLSERILGEHRSSETQVVLDSHVAEFETARGSLTAVHVNGTRHPTEALLVAAGSLPESTLAESAGLESDNGIRVDGSMRTSDANILATGDCTSFMQKGKWARLESVQNAHEQAKIAAATLLNESASYVPRPYFWSDQGGLKLQMTGLWRPGLTLVERPGPSDKSYSFFHYQGDVLECVESVNSAHEHMSARKLIERGISPSSHKVSDPTFALKDAL